MTIAVKNQKVDISTVERLNLVILGHVDHGKSTVIGRLLHDAGALPEGRLDAIRTASERRGMPFEWAFVLDALQAERDQGITIDSTQVWFATQQRRYAIIDAPGHREFLKNMVTGAAHADAALLVVDVREGVAEQTRRHAYLLHLLGIRQVAVLVNKMDAADFSESAFTNVSREIAAYLKNLGIAPTHVIPVCARDGDNIVHPSKRMGFYKGPTVLAALETFRPPVGEAEKPLRFAVQDVYKFDDRRILAGRIESGRMAVGDTLLFSPANVRARVASFEGWPSVSVPREAEAGQSVGITLDAPVFIDRGQVASHTAAAPMLTGMFRARVFWLGKMPLEQGRRYALRIGTAEMQSELREIESILNVDTLEKHSGRSVPPGGVAEAIFRTRGLCALDSFADNPHSGRFVIMEHYHIGGGGIIDLTGFADQRVEMSAVKSQHISPTGQGIASMQRAAANGHLGGILWFTGLSGAGKSTLALALQKALFAKGYQVFVLDGDNIRKGLCRDLGFSPAERNENLRRAGEVATLFAQAGFIVITAFISPTHDSRALARSAAPEHFHSVFVKADLATCEKRDSKGLYKKARAGQIAEFTGISAPYDEPVHPDVVVDTAKHDVEACVRQLVRYVEQQFIDPVRGLLAEGAHEALEDFFAAGI